MLRNDNVHTEVQSRQSTLGEKYKVDIDAIVQGHAEIAFAKPNGDKDQPSWTDKRGSLDSLAKHLGMYIERREVKAELTFEAFKRRFEEGT